MPVPGEIQPTERQSNAAPDFNALLRGALPSAEDVDVIAAKPGDPWIFVHNPEHWEVESVGGKAVMLPQLTKIKLSPGMNHVSTKKQGADATEHLRLCFQELVGRGLTILDVGRDVPAAVMPALPKSAKVRGYIAEYRAKDPDSSIAGTAHMEAWDVPTKTPPRQRQRFAYDRERFNAWRLYLVESGQVQPCPSSLANAEIARAKSRHMRRLATAYTPDVKEIKLAESKAAIELAESAAKPPARKPKAEGVPA